MKKAACYSLLLVLMLLSGNLNGLMAQSKKNVSLKNYNEVYVSSGIDLYLSMGNTEHITVTAHPDLLKNVVIEKEENKLVVKYRDNLNWSRILKGQSIKVYISYKNLIGISASGGSDVYTQNTIKSEKLSIMASGGSDLNLLVDTRNLQIQVSGGSDLSIKGKTANLDSNCSGGSDIDALQLKVENARVNASGGSDVNIFVTNALIANASGGSDIHYKGNPSLKSSADKSGDVVHIQE